MLVPLGQHLSSHLLEVGLLRLQLNLPDELVPPDCDAVHGCCLVYLIITRRHDHLISAKVIYMLYDPLYVLYSHGEDCHPGPGLHQLAQLTLIRLGTVPPARPCRQPLKGHQGHQGIVLKPQEKEEIKI